MPSLAARIRRAPRPYDAAAGARTAAAFADVEPAARELLAGTAGCSGFLAGLMEREAEWLRETLERAPEDVLAETLAAMEVKGSVALGAAVRIARRRVALLVGLADLGGAWGLDAVTGALSALADRATGLGLTALVTEEAARGRLPGVTEADIPDAAGMFVLGMGKLGARELNYSSDIDLIVLFDETRHDPEDYADVRKSFIRVTQRLVKLLSEVTEDGYVFRTDLRLRPDPSVTPVCIASEPAEHYYESVGRTWERAAYIKARPIAGAIEAGERFLGRLTPFVWRRHLDFAAIEDAHDMRLRIRAHKGLGGALQIPGHNIKLGQGGIREIEFFTQTRQLIVGGRDAGLRQRETLVALDALAGKGWVDREAAKVLAQVYVAHREVEHRLQMLEDAQTQTLPESDEGMERVAAFCGLDRAAFERELTERLETVKALTETFFEAERRRPAAEAPVPEEVFADPEAALGIIGEWQRLPALRSERARSIFKRLEPEFVRRMAGAASPDAALRSLDQFLRRLPAGVQLFSLMEANPPLLDLLVDICGSAPALAQYLGANVGVLDAVISADFYRPLPSAAEMRADLASRLNGVDYEAALNAARVWMKERHFRIGVLMLRQLLEPEEAAAAYSAVADAVIGATWPAVVAEFTRKHGPPPGAGAVVVAMGKLGSREMTVSSDLDLIVIYDAEGADSSEGARPLATPVYFSRLTQALISALTAPMAEGILYRVDMRLRPSGRSGPLATSLAAFQRYQSEDAWTWEHMALTRARVVAGPARLGEAATAAIRAVLAGPHDPAKVLADAADMRRRLGEAHEAAAANPWEVKLGPGRMMDVELLAQTGALVCDLGAIRSPRRMLEKLGSLGWIAREDAAALAGSLARLAALQQVMRLASDHTMDPAEGGEGLVRLVLAVTGESDLDALRRKLGAEATRATAVIARRLGA